VFEAIINEQIALADLYQPLRGAWGYARAVGETGNWHSASADSSDLDVFGTSSPICLCLPRSSVA